MTRQLLAKFALFVLVSMCSRPAHAQIATYDVTGTITWGFHYNPVDGATMITGESVSGTLTIDLGDEPHKLSYFPTLGGETGSWSDGGLSIDLITASGCIAGTHTFPDPTVEYHYFDNSDWPLFSNGYQDSSLYDYAYSDSGASLIDLDVTTRGTPGDGIAGNAFTPVNSGTTSSGRVTKYDFVTGESCFYDFTLDSLTLRPRTIVVAGVDTGIDDFEFEGVLASVLLEELAAESDTLGGFASGVAQLTTQFVKAGLITKEQRLAILKSAAQSNGEKQQ